MAIYQTGGYQVKTSAVEKIRKAIKDFVPHVQENEPGTHMYLAWQQKDDPPVSCISSFSRTPRRKPSMASRKL
jgi:quinol monooxygenase YgiN